MADQQELVEQLFDAALAIKPGDRSAFLDKVCGENLELKRSVESRLRSKIPVLEALSTPQRQVSSTKQP